VVLRRSQRVQQNEGEDEEGGYGGISHLATGPLHLLEVHLVDDALAKEHCVVVDHHQNMM
jgi:hypothetical protein